MKVSLNWLKDYVKIPKEIELSRLAYDLTMSTVEVEKVIDIGAQFDKIVLGVIKEVTPHPDADKLRICKTDIGDKIKDIVCGGTNLKAGMKVAVALPGSWVRWHGEGEPVEISIAKLRGVESYGMICASSELGLADLFPSVEKEILDLSDFDFKAGTSLAEVLNLHDTILEIDNKSLTNRPDLWGHYGVAREISALYNLPLEEFKSFKQPLKSDFLVVVKEEELCPRYIGVKFTGLSVKSSPYEIQKRLWSVGLRPINALVDITNYVMLATGQPTHAFDADVIKGSITVRKAQDKEKLLLLDGKELNLSKEDLVIADDAEAIALAGVMGGVKDSINPNTKNIILEIANFKASKIRECATKYDVRSESAIRYEKGIDTARCELALSLAVELLSSIYPQIKIVGFHDNYSQKPEKNTITLSLKWLEKRLGKKIPNSKITSILNCLGFEVSITSDVLKVIVPSWRSTGDISFAVDILEEIARMYGFENFTPAPIAIKITSSINQVAADLDRKIREYLALRSNMQEVYTYPWVNEEHLHIIHGTTEGLLSLLDPPSPEESFLRASLIPSLCKVSRENLRYKNEFAIFESASVFMDSDYKSEYDKKEMLPKEKKSVAGAFVSSFTDASLLFRKAKGIIENMPRYIHAEPLSFKSLEKPYWADDKVWINIIQGEKIIGNMALLTKKKALEFDIKNANIVLFELDIDALIPYSSRTNKFIPLPNYPLVEYDLSLLFADDIKWSDITASIKDKDNILRNITFIEEYKADNIDSDKKSLTMRLTIGSLEKTLTSLEIESYIKTVVEEMNHKFGAQLRN